MRTGIIIGLLVVGFVMGILPRKLFKRHSLVIDFISAGFLAVGFGIALGVF